MFKYLMMIAASVMIAGCNPTKPSENSIKTPTNISYVMDEAKVLTSSQASSLREKLSNFKKSNKKSPELIVLTVDSLNGLSVEEYANGFFKKVKIGNKDYDNGVLVVLAPKERKIRIEVGYGFEGVLPDTKTALVIKSTMIPHLKKGSENWYKALDESTNMLIVILGKEE